MSHFSPAPNEAPKEKARSKEVGKVATLLCLAVGIYFICWILFHFFLSRNDEEPSDIPEASLPVGSDSKKNAGALNSPPGTQQNGQYRVLTRSGEPPLKGRPSNGRKNDDPFQSRAAEHILSLSSRQPVEATIPTKPIYRPEVPPGEIPPGVALEGEITCNKCWDKSGLQYSQSECDTLDEFTRRLSKRLYIVDRCQKEAVGDNALGLLHLGLEIDFGDSTLGFWNDPSSEIRGSVKTAACLNSELKGFPLKGLSPQYVRYQLSLYVRFDKPGAVQTIAEHRAEDNAEELERLGRGKRVEVIRDRVRVRKRPINGEILGMINSGNRVILLDHQEGWCRVVTPRGNMGWMICWALDP
ncbi:MAG: SH3 domain-containing protein [Proteobacteria bacterium]|nr:SH3 domain-containing protein [Pseudomonadota bacterium]